MQSPDKPEPIMLLILPIILMAVNVSHHAIVVVQKASEETLKR